MKSFATASALAMAVSLTSACSIVSNSEVTFYGYPDNSPPGASVAHDCGGRNGIAGGSGTYADPLTFATAPGEYSPCEIVYLPLLKKYLRYEDDCEQCETDYKSGKQHIDVWTGSSTTNGGQAQIDCEDDLTTGGSYQVVRQPPQGLDVDSSALFANGQCNKGAVFESNQASCDGGSSASNDTVATTAAASATATTTRKHRTHHTSAATSNN